MDEVSEAKGSLDMIRPALYQAWLDIRPVQQGDEGHQAVWDIVGPVCETGDFLGKARHLTLSVDRLLAVRSAGAYGFTMASNYNSRPRVAEVLIDGDQIHLVRQREQLEDLWQGESLLP